MAEFPKKITDDPYGAAILVRRLIMEQGLTYWRRYLTAFVLMGISAGTTALSTYILGQVINQAYVDKNVRGIALLSGVTLLLFLIKGASTYAHTVMLSQISNAILAHNQRRLFAKLMSESVAFFSERHSSEFLARLTAGANSVTQVLNLLINALGRDFLLLIGLVAVMVMQDPVMAMLGFLVAPPAMFVLRKLVKRIKGLAYNQFTGTADILETMQESLQGIRTVKAFTLEETMRQRIDDSIVAVERNANKMARVSNRSSPLMETLGGFAVAGGLMYGGYSVVALGATPGQFFTFLAAFLMAYEPAKRLARLNIELNAGLIGARMLLEIVDSPASELSDDDKPSLALSESRVEFQDVSFAYRANEQVLNRMSFVAEPGKVTALVGPSGGGKSTVLALLLRFYEVSDGDILIDGQQIAKVSRKSLRQQTAYVGQDVYLFRDSIRNNIAFGKQGATEADIVEAAKAACAHDFIMSFPLGYDTPVGEHGTQLSGGQRQRVAVARALIKNAPIILLDEATAALDSESEKQVQEAIEHLCQNRTTIVIAHRLHTITHADTILVVEAGEIVERGRHDDLLRRNGRYASFFRLQHRGPTLAPVSATA
ncbi:ABC transporter ATP-binding protein [Bradyrhizobium sp.]|jgi:ATP-binding cassette subfamily B protein|uniref:ABC transporter ATP-binding protein n=1 Tax=Bradyrhizobium sp. TaxID=376 RepID=UPI002D0444C8|nr:ABC transporter ATP-binding protein [Bradyrhizobium sp.]HWX56971.1 ABC transporter ATP-binding protein [Bradyrhizobium sp.]